MRTNRKQPGDDNFAYQISYDTHDYINNGETSKIAMIFPEISGMAIDQIEIAKIATPP
jgi:hypothetical protein